MAEKGNAELIAEGQSRRVAVDLTKLEPVHGVGSKVNSASNSPEAEIEGNIHDSGDLQGIVGATLKIEGSGEFKVDFDSPTHFTGVFVPRPVN